VEPLRQRVELGAFLSDTAKLYGLEEIVGRAVRAGVNRCLWPPKLAAHGGGSAHPGDGGAEGLWGVRTGWLKRSQRRAASG
jgi:hypothetical protein